MLRKVNMMTGIMLAIMPMSALAIELTDYPLPEKRYYQNWSIGGSFDLKDGYGDQASFEGDFSSEYDLTFSTLPLIWELEGNGTIDFGREENEDAETEEGYELGVQTNIDKYFEDVKTFAFLAKVLEKIAYFGADTRGQEVEFLTYGEIELGYRKKEAEDDAKDPHIEIGGGIGYGRIIDATQLARAIRFVKELQKYEVIAPATVISDEAYLKLADIFEKEDEYEEKYSAESYKRYWFDDMEQTLQDEGALPQNTVETIGVLRLQEIVDEEESPVLDRREHGRIFKIGPALVVSDYDGRSNIPSWQISYEYARPLSLKFQLLENANYSMLFDEGVNHDVVNELSANYELSERLTWKNLWTFTISLPAEEVGDDFIGNNLTSTLSYYITNRITLDLKGSFDQIAKGVDESGNDDVKTRITLEITYDLIN